MNKYLTCAIIFLSLVLQSCTTDADDDSDNWDASVVCPETGTNSYGMPNRGTFTDERDGQVYKYTTIGNQVWMAENLKYDAEYSEIITDDYGLDKYTRLMNDTCDSRECRINVLFDLFGRYYSLQMDGKYNAPRNQSLIDSICPMGWHVPSESEWNVLVDNMGKKKADAASRLKSSDNSFGVDFQPGTDPCLFSSLPAGGVRKSSERLLIDSQYWTSTSKSYEYMLSIRIAIGIYIDYTDLKLPIRCLKD